MPLAADGEQKRESAGALIVIGLGLLLACLLVVFFAPASFKTGHDRAFTTIIAVLAVLGLGLVIFGRQQRKRVL